MCSAVHAPRDALLLSGAPGPEADLSTWPTRPELAARLGVSGKTIGRLVATGDLEEVRVSPHSRRISPSSVRRHLARNFSGSEANVA